MDRVSLREPQDIEQRLAAIKSKMQTLAPAALAADKAALKQIESLEAEQTAIGRQANLQALAANEAKRLAAEAEQEAARKARAAREQQALQEAQIVLSTSADIDAALLKLREIFERRHRALRSLALTRVCSTHLVNRMFSKFNATSSAYAHGLRDFISLEPMLPEHVRKLSDADSWLSKPLTAVDEPMPDDDEPAPRTNGADK